MIMYYLAINFHFSTNQFNAITWKPVIIELSYFVKT